MRALKNLPLLEARLSRIDWFVHENDIRRNLRDTLSHFPDLERSMVRISLGRALPRDLKAISQGLQVAQVTKQMLQLQDFWKFNLPDDLSSTLLQMLEENLPSIQTEGGLIKVGADPKLDELRYARDFGEIQIKELEQRYQAETGINNLKIAKNNLVGYFIEITTSGLRQATKLPEQFFHRQAISNGARYMTIELQDLAGKLTEAAAATIQYELKLFGDLCEQILGQREVIDMIAAQIAEIDVYSAMAELAVVRNYVRPNLTNGHELNIVSGRHPVIDAAIDNFTSNNCNLNVHNFALLTGPNMAGKSTYLRQNALIVWMAQCGMYVPAVGAQIGLVDQIFSRIGAADDLSAGRSTFMVEMVETASILHQATNLSFVILDEIGRGTSTQDGLAIARAVSEYIINNIKARCMFATHYHELVDLAKSYPIKLLTMKIIEHKSNVVFLHEVIDGYADKSYGIHVAELAGLPSEVIARARNLLKQEIKTIPNVTTIASFPDNETNIFKLLRSIKPDDLSPKQALEVLYKLKELLSGNKNRKPENVQTRLFN